MRIDSPGKWDELPGDFPGFGPDETLVQQPQSPQKPWWRRWRWKHLVYGTLAMLMLIIAWLAITAPLSKSLQPIAAPSLTLLSADGEPIARRGADIREPVKLAQLPKHVPNAFIAIEDRRFQSHWGISLRGIARAAFRNLGAGGVREGGSTITQQLAKISFLSSKRTAGRKLQEVLIAFWLESWLSKDEILERYLSNVYLGDNVYGLRAASHHYFSVPPEQLTVPQAAMLAGMVKAPSRLAPTRNYKDARARGKLVIAAMVDQGFLTRTEANRLKPVKLRVERQQAVPTGTYFADWVLPAARASGDEGYGEQQIQTTLEARLQKIAQQTVRRAGLGKAQVALVAMRPDGRVVAMIGGKDYARSPFNRATQARRQPGSAFKLFVWLAALRSGMSPDTPIEDRPLKIGDWQPKNYGNRYRGTLTLRDALAVSSNVAAVRLAQRVGMDNVVRTARDLGVRSPLNPNPSLALGTSGVTLLELTSAYAAVAAGAYPVTPRGLDEDERGWWDRLTANPVPGASGDPNFDDMREMLAAVVQQGTGRAAALDVPVYGKTGTSQDSRDALFIGFTRDLVVGVWVGNDDNTPLGSNVAGGGLPARIWREFTSQAVGSRPEAPKAPPIAAPAEVQGETGIGNASLTVPIEGTGYDVGVDVGEDGVTISAQPGAPQPGGDPGQRPTDQIPTLNVPPPVPRGDRGRPPAAEDEEAEPEPVDDGG
ncbi:MAG TPA: PBP1A family penicillin-binding protein [Allosphingosinicella sp.]|jgi:penicillin-binding protein 1A